MRQAATFVRSTTVEASSLGAAIAAANGCRLVCSGRRGGARPWPVKSPRPSSPNQQAQRAIRRASRDLCRSVAGLSNWNARIAAFAQGTRMIKGHERDWNALIERRGRRQLGRSRDRQAGQGAVRDHHARRDARWRRSRHAGAAANSASAWRWSPTCNTHEAMGRRVAKALKALRHDRGDRHARQSWNATSRRSRMVQEKTRHADALIAVGSGALSRHLQIRDLQGWPALCDVRHRRLDERLCRLDRLGHARQRLQDVAARACAARHLPRPQGLGRRADLAVGRGPRRQPVPLDRADRLVGLASPVRHLLFEQCPMRCRSDDEAADDRGGRGPCAARARRQRLICSAC